MKKITALLLCFLLLCICTVTVFGAEIDDKTTNTIISVNVPNSHKIAVMTDAAKVFYEGVCGEEFVVERLSEPRLLIRAESGKVIKSVTINGVDVTHSLHGGYLDLDPIFENKIITVHTEDELTAPNDLYTIKGKVTLNGQPLNDVDLELRSTLKTTKTDKNGCFTFNNVETGEHSLTALNDGKVIGFLSFTLQKDNKSDLVLLDDGTYTVSVDKNGAGVELHLEFDEDKGVLAPSDVKTVKKIEYYPPQTGDNGIFYWWLLLSALSVICIAVLETYHRMKNSNKS